MMNSAWAVFALRPWFNGPVRPWAPRVVRQTWRGRQRWSGRVGVAGVVARAPGSNGESAGHGDGGWGSL
jgi:hypothetical protein